MGLPWVSGRRAALVIGAGGLVLVAVSAFTAREWRAGGIASGSVAPGPAAPEVMAPGPVAPADTPAPVAAPAGGKPPAGPQAAGPGAPEFDVVRVAPDGQAVVAGRAPPGARVTVRTDAGPLAEVAAGADGSFVAFFAVPPSPVPQTLSLSAVGETAAQRSAEVVLLLPSAPGAGAASAEDPAAVAGATASGPSAERTAREASVPAEAEVAATAILRPEGIEVVPGEGAGPAQGAVTLAGISYGAAGQVVLSGRGPAGARLRAYVDDAFALEGAVDGSGRWRMALGDVATGVYRLRIDALGPDGAVTSRVETPFQRDFPAPGGAAPAGSVVVQPGNNLWTLARIHYGEGLRYTQIFTVNREMIRNPDLIYPGQIFVLPEDDGIPVLPEDERISVLPEDAAPE